ncbi:GTPase HflX [Aerococcaceae bacterium DSM 111020]|nr:GTPase HflX [Aerococcaceae bacterium DSM 111020]
MIETGTQPERILLIGVQTQLVTDEQFANLLNELAALTKTAGGIVVDYVTQKRSTIHNRSLVGTGKLEEIQSLVEARDIDLVISQNELTPSTNNYLEEAIGVRVIDRTQLILDIFAMRAKSREGKLQVEMAQYDYLLSRIVGKGLELSRQGGGIGTRGPGETQLESDRRYIRSRMLAINKELQQVEKHRERTRQRRLNGREFNIGLIGYTNAGKSTLLTELTKQDTYIKDQLFATLDPLTRKFKINGHDAFTITDTVGFIEDLPTELVNAFESTLEEIRYMDLLLHVVDASHSAHMMHEETVLSLLNDLEIYDVPILTVYNKVDQLTGAFEATKFPNILMSAKNPKDIERLKAEIWDLCIAHAEPYQMRVLPEEADLLALYQQNTLVTAIEFNEEQEYYELTGYRNPIKNDKEADNE